MRFLHTGDLHLDSPFSLSGTVGAEAKREGQRRTLGRIFDLAAERQCQMILVAGDLFDSKYVTPETEGYIKELVAKAGIPVIVAPGNHDPYVSGSFYCDTELPENLYVFSSSELQCFDFPELDTCVWGYAFTSAALTRSPLAGEERGDRARINLLLAHADLSSPISRYCPLTVGDIESFGIDYAALGHIHNVDSDGIPKSNTIRYCGFPQGRSFDELGDGGVLVVDCDGEGNTRVESVSVSSHRYEIRELDLSRYTSRTEISAKIEEEAHNASVGKDTFLRIYLTGVADIDTIPNLSIFEKGLVGGSLLSVELRDMTIPVADVKSLSADKSLRGELYRTLYSGLVSDDVSVREMTAIALRIGLDAIEGRQISGGGEEL